MKTIQLRWNDCATRNDLSYSSFTRWETGEQWEQNLNIFYHITLKHIERNGPSFCTNPRPNLKIHCVSNSNKTQHKYIVHCVKNTQGQDITTTNCKKKATLAVMIAVEDALFRQINALQM